MLWRLALLQIEKGSSFCAGDRPLRRTVVTQATRVISRRHFLHTGAVAASAALVGRTVGAGHDNQGADIGGFKVGVQSYTFRDFSTEQMLKRIQDLGLGWVEFYSKHANPASTPEQIKALFNLCAQYKVKPIAFGVHTFTKNHDRNRKAFEFGKALGITTLSADPDPDSFDSLDKLVAEYDIAIAIHPHGPIGNGRLHRWYSAELIMDAVKNHHPKIGSCLDTGHLIHAAQLGKNLDSAEQVRVMGARNFGMHLKDHDNKKDTDVPFGQGVLDLASVLKALKDVNFKGYISIEYEANPKDPMADMTACVQYLREVAKKA
jgi:inosose dehydratase